MMKGDIDQGIKSCQTCPERSKAGRKLTTELQRVKKGVRLVTVAANIQGPVTRKRHMGNK